MKKIGKGKFYYLHKNLNKTLNNSDFYPYRQIKRSDAVCGNHFVGVCIFGHMEVCVHSVIRDTDELIQEMH